MSVRIIHTPGIRAYVIDVIPARRLLGRHGPIVCGVMSDAPPELIQEWVG